jgi:hypothetical protein
MVKAEAFGEPGTPAFMQKLARVAAAGSVGDQVALMKMQAVMAAGYQAGMAPEYFKDRDGH